MRPVEYARMQIREDANGRREVVIYATGKAARSPLTVGEVSWGELAGEAMAFARAEGWRPEEASLYWYVARDNQKMTRNLERDA